MSIRIIRLLYSGPSVSVGQYDMAFFENGPAGHNFDWDGEGTIYFSRVQNSIAKVSVGSGTAVLNAGNGRAITFSGRCGVYDVTSLFKNNGSVNKYVDLYRYALPGQTLIRQEAFLIISVGGIFCPVNLDIR